MSYLLYASNEMFSSTQLIRKSKDIFDKLISQDIDKAVILRDGKPNFMLLEFAKYEEIMTDYINLKKLISKNNHITEHIKLNLDVDTIKTKNVAVSKEKTINTPDEVNEEELKKAFEQIEALNLDKSFKDEVKDELKEKSSAEIKEFWN